MEDGGDREEGQDAGTSNLQSTFDSRASFDVNEPVGSASISPAGRDVALASRLGLHIIDLDNPYSPPRYLPHRTPWEVADVQWSPFASRDYWIASTSNQKALIWNVAAPAARAVEHVLQAHTRALTDINFSAHDPDMLATCAVDSFVHCWDLRTPSRPVISFADWYAGATQVKWNRQDGHILASSHDEKFHIWDTRKDSHPLRTIDAHLTKIYGIDWNRVEASHLLTCSLDRTIKLWDYTADEDNMLMRTIHTPYPVWRARHTPFGYGVLVMPQRGDNELHLYDRRLHDGEPQDAPAEPVHTFEGHTNQVKEFLWRVRHGEENGKDNRSFQLVSWAADKQLRLHPMSEEVLDKIGYKQGQPLHTQQRFSRKGALNRSYNDPDKVQNATGTPLLQPSDQGRRKSAISDALNANSNSRILPVSDSMATIRVHRGVESGMRVSSSDRKQGNPISWMRGVKISTKDDTSSPRDSTSIMTTSQILPWDSPESLGEEISSAGDRYKNVQFEDVSVAARTIAVSANGPFGHDRASVYVQMTVIFPPGYPKEDVPEFIIEKTSSIAESAFQRMSLELKILCEEYKQEQQGCIAAIFRYVTGDQTLEQSLAWLKTTNNVRNDLLDTPTTEESSSDEEDNIIGQMADIRSRNIGSSAGDLIQRNANVPIPKHCAALFAPNGKLVCFFPTPEPAASLLDSVSQLSKDGKSQDLFEGFGNLQHALGKHAGDVKAIMHETGSQSSEESFSSGSSSFGSSEDAVDVVPFSTFTLWGADVVPRPRSLNRSLDRSQRRSQHQSYVLADPKQPRMHVSVYNIEDDDSSYPKRSLAESYIIIGQGDAVCVHNARVARDKGYPELGDVWDLVRLMLCDEVPLHITPEMLDRENILVVARRGIVHIKRKDSGLDFGFDHPVAVREPKLKAHIKWGQHPLGSEYLVRAIFDHFLYVGDVQMLAMLSCVFFEPASTLSNANAVLHKDDERLPSNLNIPGFSLPYWPNTHSARSLEVPKPPSPAVPLRSSMKVLASGAASSVDSDHTYLAPTVSATSMPTIIAEMEDGTRTKARPILLPHKGSLDTTKGLSASPEHVLRRSSSIVGNAFNKVAFLLSHSPPLQRKEAAGAASAELSTSAPSASIPIPKARVKGEAGSVRFSEPTVDPRSASSGGHDNTGDTESDNEPRSRKLRVKLKNQDQFDDEACFTNPLVPPQNAWQHKHWREEYAGHLDAWNLSERYLELLSFNHFDPPFKTSKDATATHGRSQKVTPVHAGLEMSILCTRCHKAVPNAVTVTSGSRRCLACEKVSASVCCSICGELVQGLHKTCLSCGHASHQLCYEMWIADQVGTQSEDGCEVGCGCHCPEDSAPDQQSWIATVDAAHEDALASERPSTAVEAVTVTSSPQISPTKSGVDRYGTARTRKSLLSYSMSGWGEPDNVDGS